MRRAQAILVLVALLSLPLVLVGQSAAPQCCDHMCCVRHMHSSNPADSVQPEEMSCHHGATGHVVECGLRCSHSNLDFGLLAPIPPAMISSLAALTPPAISRVTIPSAGYNSAAGFLPSTFEPPRA